MPEIPLRLFLSNTLPLVIIVGFTLDMILGDPEFWPHPVKRMGKFAKALESMLYPDENKEMTDTARAKAEFRAGAFVSIFHPLLLASASTLLIIWLYNINPQGVLILRLFLAYQLLAAKSLYKEAGLVAKILRRGSLKDAREQLARIVGRDTENLSAEDVIRATVETVAENFSDGVIAPLFYLLIGDIPLMLFYKCVNTHDSLFGYKNEKYGNFGKTAAKLDDVLNYIPARIAAFLLIIPMPLFKADARKALEILKRDGRKHESPNAGLCEASAAGGLHLQLGGPSIYGGRVVEKEFIGDYEREPAISDIDKINKIHLCASTLAAIFAILLAGFFFGLIFKNSMPEIPANIKNIIVLTEQMRF